MPSKYLYSVFFITCDFELDRYLECILHHIWIYPSMMSIGFSQDPRTKTYVTCDLSDKASHWGNILTAVYSYVMVSWVFTDSQGVLWIHIRNMYLLCGSVRCVLSRHHVMMSYACLGGYDSTGLRDTSVLHLWDGLPVIHSDWITRSSGSVHTLGYVSSFILLDAFTLPSYLALSPYTFILYSGVGSYLVISLEVAVRHPDSWSFMFRPGRYSPYSPPHCKRRVKHGKRAMP